MWLQIAVFELCLSIVLAAAPAGAQSVRALHEQSAQQTQKDIAECQAAAMQTSGYPGAPPPVSFPAAPAGGDRMPRSAFGAAARAADAEARARQSAYQQAVQGCLSSRGYSYTP